ncbi:hypothetical protein [Streptomyces sp. cmx-4-9]|uniref:hypothetical protein n=1 Tax=Streptomyces sp. cmx-4-9 TaxID=2790941 RepID=UPI003980F0D1
MSDYLTDAEVRDILRPLQDDGPVGRLYATGEIADELMLELTALASPEGGGDEQADRIMEVIQYVTRAGYRPPVKGWTA